MSDTNIFNSDCIFGTLTEREREGLEILNHRRTDFVAITTDQASRAADVMAAERKVPNLFELCCKVNDIVKRIHDCRYHRFGQSVKLALREVAQGEESR